MQRSIALMWEFMYAVIVKDRMFSDKIYVILGIHSNDNMSFMQNNPKPN